MYSFYKYGFKAFLDFGHRDNRHCWLIPAFVSLVGSGKCFYFFDAEEFSAIDTSEKNTGLTLYM